MKRADAEVVCDFDGTITEVDTVDLLLERLADPAWREIEERWVRGEIGSRACMAGQIELLRGGWPDIAEVLRDVAVDPSFAPFAAWCREAGVPLRVVSEGLDRVIHHVLARSGIVVDDVRASRLVERKGGEWSLRFPAFRTKRCEAALCKCAVVDAAVPRLSVLVGDGRSDFCCSSRAGVVFAFSKLAIHCAQNDVPFVPFEGFDGVRRFLEARMASGAVASAAES